jgi:hypothetical protein
MLVQLLYQVLDKFWAVQLFVLVHKEVAFFQPLLHPYFYPLHPVIDTGVIAGMQGIAHKTYETFGCA